MFQNIESEIDTDEIQEEKFMKTDKKKALFGRIFTKQNIILYIISFMISTVNCGTSMAPFGIAIFAAVCSNKIPAGVIYVATLIGTLVGFGTSGLLNYILISAIFITMILILKPKCKQEGQEQKLKLGWYVFTSTFFVQAFGMLFNEFIVYDLLLSISYGITSFIFYKIFDNSLIVIKEFGIKKAFSIEEVVGASLIFAISTSAFRDFSIFGFEIRNVLSILIVLILGWKNGMLLGATSGITIGSVIGIIGASEPNIIAAYALSGMLAGLLNKLGKIGVIIGFVAGNVLLTYVTNGSTLEIIYFKEILIASLGLLLVPNSISINIEEFFEKNKCLPEGAKYRLEENKETIYKLNTVSETIQEMSNAYKEVAATVVEDEEETIPENKLIFIDELNRNLENISENILYEDIYQTEEGIIDDIFRLLNKKQEISREDLIKVFENYNNYIVGFENETINEAMEEDIEEMIKTINDSYKISKLNFIWKQKVNENKKTISNQLDGVSKVISDIAQDIQDEKNEFKSQEEEIRNLCKQKNIDISYIKIMQEKNKRYIVNVYMEQCRQDEIKECPTSRIQKIISKVLKENIVIQKEKCAIKNEEEICRQIYVSQDKYSLQLGIAKETKQGMVVSGDSNIQTKLEDGKYLLAISDGMGSRTKCKKE